MSCTYAFRSRSAGAVPAPRCARSPPAVAPVSKLLSTAALRARAEQSCHRP
jgi:hypothetical protein